MKSVYIFVTHLFLFYCLTNSMERDGKHPRAIQANVVERDFKHLRAIQAFADSDFLDSKVVTDDMPKDLKEAIVERSLYLNVREDEFFNSLERHAIALRRNAHAKAMILASRDVGSMHHYHTFKIEPLLSCFSAGYSPVAKFTFSPDNKTLTVHSAKTHREDSPLNYNCTHRGYDRTSNRYFQSSVSQGCDTYQFNLDSKQIQNSTHAKPKMDLLSSLFLGIVHWPVDDIVCQLSHDGIYYAYADNKGNTEQAHFPNKLQIHVFKKGSANALQEMLKDNDKTQAVAVSGSDNTKLINAIQRVYPMPDNLSSEREWLHCTYTR